ncbi:MAG: hypothetical protein MUP03_04725 [Anaerolineales bacterium]|nr:hypothetical protein [Anaerolineales bacterium]
MIRFGQVIVALGSTRYTYFLHSPVSPCLTPFRPGGALPERGGGFPRHRPPHHPDAFSGGQVCQGATGGNEESPPVGAALSPPAVPSRSYGVSPASVCHRE